MNDLRSRELKYFRLEMVEAAGVETLGDDFLNWLMAHEFWV